MDSGPEDLDPQSASYTCPMIRACVRFFCLSSDRRAWARVPDKETIEMQVSMAGRTVSDFS